MSGPTEEKAIRFGLPERWIYCPRMGQIVEDLFVPFKTPLCSFYDSQLDEQHRFHPEDVFNTAAEQGRAVESRGCTYRKIRMEGHGGAPTMDQVDEFVLAVRTFLKRRQGNELVAVHCTHGFNRTGFAIASYLVRERDMSVEYAIQMFASQRPCGIYKQEYINELFQRFGDMDDCLEAPDRPSWELGEDVSADFTVPAPPSNRPVAGSSQQSSNDKKFMDGKVPNVFLVEDNSKKDLLRGRIQSLCHYQRDGFPGLQPVSLNHQNICLLAKIPYRASWKADGMRYMVYITQEEVFAFDRDNEVFQIMGLDFPHRKEPRSIGNTLVDAEMILEMVEHNGAKRTIPRLLIYDIIHYEQYDLGKQDFDTRSACIEKEIIGPRRHAMEKGLLRPQSMSVRRKEFWTMDVVHKLFEEKFTKNLGHEIDGLIFQPVKLAYTSGRCDQVLKWKPPSHNSVDFLLRIKKEERPGMLPEFIGYLYVLHKADPFGCIKATKALKPYDNKIIECTFDMRTKSWIFMRERTDKSIPNALSTAHSVYDSIINPITQEGLIRFIEKHCMRKRPAPVKETTEEAKKVKTEDNKKPHAETKKEELP